MYAFVQGIIQDVSELKTKVSIKSTNYKVFKVYQVKTQIFNNSDGMTIPVIIPTKKKDLIAKADEAFKKGIVIDVSGIIFSRTLPSIYRMQKTCPQIYENYLAGMYPSSELRHTHINGLIAFSIEEASLIYRDFKDASTFECICKFKTKPSSVILSGNKKRFRCPMIPLDDFRDTYSREIPVMFYRESVAAQVETGKTYKVSGIYYTHHIKVCPFVEFQPELASHVEHVYLFINEVTCIE